MNRIQNNYQPAITSITRGPRQSNFELLRIIAMIMVMTVHAGYSTFGGITEQSARSNLPIETLRAFAESFGVIGVDIFVLISGWFGIRASYKGLLSFVFQFIFIYTLSFFFVTGLDLQPLTLKNSVSIIALNPNLRGYAWFVIAYLALYALSPVLNKFIETTEKKVYRNVLIVFFIVQTIYGCIGSSPIFNMGYSTLSFIGLYLLSAYIKHYKPNCCAKWGGYAVVIIYIINACVYVFFPYFGIPFAHLFHQYSSPSVIIIALLLVLIFSNFHINTSRFINFLAASSFAAYLLHCNPYMFPSVFSPMIKNAGSTFGFFGIICVMIIFYFIAVILDQPRKLIWKWVSRKFL